MDSASFSVSLLCSSILSIAEEREIVEIGKKKKLDFDDALQYFVAKQTGCNKIVSFDKHFDKTDLVRKTPMEIMHKTNFDKKRVIRFIFSNQKLWFLQVQLRAGQMDLHF